MATPILSVKEFSKKFSKLIIPLFTPDKTRPKHNQAGYNFIMDRLNHELVESKISAKVIHFPTTDILVPTNHQKMDDYIEFFKDGLPKDFVEVSPEIFFDSETNPTLVVKQRIMTAKDIQKKRSGEGYDSITDASMNASNSLMNEFSLAQDIQQVTDSDTAQQFAKNLGYEGLRYVRPIVGIIDKTDGNKYMVYPYIAGKSWHRNPPGMVIADQEPVQVLINLFEEKGINPEDLLPKQMRIGTDNWMYLMDTDQYHKTPTVTPEPTL